MVAGWFPVRAITRSLRSLWPTCAPYKEQLVLVPVTNTSRYNALWTTLGPTSPASHPLQATEPPRTKDDTDDEPDQRCPRRAVETALERRPLSHGRDHPRRLRRARGTDHGRRGRRHEGT